MKNDHLLQRWNIFSEDIAIENLGRKRITLAALPLIILILAGTILIYLQQMSAFLQGSKWSNAGLEVVIILEDQIMKIIGYLLIVLGFYLVLNFYRKYNDFPISGLTLLNLVLVFITIVAANDLIKLICAKLTMDIPRLGEDINHVYRQIIQLKGFATGLDLLIPPETKASLLTRLMETINVFNILAFGYLYTQLSKIKKNCLWIVLILVIVFLIIAIAFDSFSLISMMSWND